MQRVLLSRSTEQCIEVLLQWKSGGTVFSAAREMLPRACIPSVRRRLDRLAHPVRGDVRAMLACAETSGDVISWVNRRRRVPGRLAVAYVLSHYVVPMRFAGDLARYVRGTRIL